MTETSPLKLLHTEYAQLERRDPATLSSDQKRSLIYYREEVALAAQPSTAPSGQVAAWTRSLLALERFVAREGRWPRENNRLGADSFSPGEQRLATWVRTERRSETATRRCSYQLDRLGCVPGYTRHPIEDRWELRRAEYEEFTLKHQHAPMLRGAQAGERSLAGWAAKQRHAHRNGRLPIRRVNALNKLAFWSWGDLKN